MIVIVSLTSWYHYLGMISYIKNNDMKIEELVLLRRTFFGKEVSYENEVLNSLAAKVVFVESEKYLSLYLNDRRFSKAYLFSSGLYPYNVARVLAKKKILYEIITIEEGIGTYGDFYNQLSSVFIAKKSTSSYYSAIYLSSKFLLTFLVKKIYFIGVNRTTWFNFNVKSIENNKDISSSYLNALKYCHELNGSNIDLDLALGDCLLISSPFCELGYISEYDYLEELSRCLSSYNKVVIKPHPMEDLNKYTGSKFYILDSSIPIEKIAINIDKKIDIFSFSSTSVYTLKVFLGFKVFRLNKIDFFYNKLSLRQKKIIDNNSTLYSELI